MNVYMITVGTSLLENFVGSTEKRRLSFSPDQLDIDLDDIDLDEETLGLDLNSFREKLDEVKDKEIPNISTIEQNIYNQLCNNNTNAAIEFKKFYEAHKGSSGTLSNWLQNINNDKICAEIKTLKKVIDSKKAADNNKIILFPTFTLSGLLVSSILSEYFQRQNFVVSTIFTSNLASTTGKNFEDGLKKFLGNLYNKVKEYKDEGKNCTVSILASGGYKSIIPYCTIIGLLTDTYVYYIYEKSDNLVQLPPLPIGIQKELLKPYAQVLQILKSKFYPSEYNNLPEKLKNLFIKENNSYKATEFFTVALNIYKNEFYKSPLQIETEGISIVKYLNNYIEYYKRIVDIAPYFWIGDKVPELVDHAQYHHDNLFAIADRILSSIWINQNDKNILNELGTFLILATIFFHDWGHVVAHIDGLHRTLLPTEIRDFHNILSYKRLEKEKESLLKKIFDADPNTKFEDSNLYPIALLSAYHRKAMPLRDEDDSFIFPFGKNGQKYEEFKPLINFNGTFDGKEIEGSQLIFLESLFRVIDSIDMQFVRAGSINELIFKFRNFQMEIEEENRRLKNLENLSPSKEQIEFYESIYVMLKNSYQSRANKGNINSDYEKLKGIYKNLAEGPLMFLYVESKLKIMMKDEQREHFLKHLFLDVPEITSNYKDGKIIINIAYRKAEKFDWNISQLNSEFPNDPVLDKAGKLDLNELVKDISSDYEKVKDILNSKNIFFNFIAE